MKPNLIVCYGSVDFSPKDTAVKLINLYKKWDGYSTYRYYAKVTQEYLGADFDITDETLKMKGKEDLLQRIERNKS